MSYVIRISDDGNYLLGKVEGMVTAEIAQMMAEEYTRLSEESGIKRLLSDVRGAPNVMSHFQDYEYAYKQVPSQGFPRDMRAAILADPNDRSHDFAEMVAKNAGYQVKVFHVFEEAVQWLLR